MFNFMLQEVDGQAFMMLVLPTVQEELGLKLGPALKLCHHVQRLKLAFYETFHPEEVAKTSWRYSYQTYYLTHVSCYIEKNTCVFFNDYAEYVCVWSVECAE